MKQFQVPNIDPNAVDRPAEPRFGESNVIPLHQDHNNLEFIGREREIGDFERAAKHSKRVGWLKYVLPIAALTIILFIIAALIFRQTLPSEISIGKTGIENGKLVMKNPKLNGLDAENRPYNIEAARAMQSVEDPTLVELVEIDANLPMDTGTSARIKAGNGSYNVTKKILELGGGINIVTSDGMTMELRDAYLDINAGTMNTDREILFTSKEATISAQALQIKENGEHIIFDTKVRLVIQPLKKKK